MEFFGLTSFGASDPIKFMLKPSHVEPRKPPSIVKILESGNYNCPLAELIRDVDIYSGIMDGYSYGSYNRLLNHRVKGFYHPKGPRDVFRDNITQTMCFGSFLDDPALKGKDWYKDDIRYPQPQSECTKVRHYLMLADKTFVPF